VPVVIQTARRGAYGRVRHRCSDTQGQQHHASWQQHQMAGNHERNMGGSSCCPSTHLQQPRCLALARLQVTLLLAHFTLDPNEALAPVQGTSQDQPQRKRATTCHGFGWMPECLQATQFKQHSPPACMTQRHCMTGTPCGPP
jgi:hypothetical protein